MGRSAPAAAAAALCCCFETAWSLHQRKLLDGGSSIEHLTLLDCWGGVQQQLRLEEDAAEEVLLPWHSIF